MPREELRGRATAVDEQGRLLIDADDGPPQAVSAGDRAAMCARDSDRVGRNHEQSRGDPVPDIPPPPGGLGPSDPDEIVDQEELGPPLPPLETGPAAPMLDVPPGPESKVPPLASTDEPLRTPPASLEEQADAVNDER